MQVLSLCRVLSLCILSAVSPVMLSQTSQLDSASATEISGDVGEQQTQQAQFEHILFAYFQQQYEKTLVLIEVANMTHAFAALSDDDQDRLKLMQGAAQLNLGLHTQAQQILLGLLAKTTSEYVQANTWYWLAKAGFENRQYYLAERAFVAIEQDDLVAFISEEQWQELIYLNTHTRMQQLGDWQTPFDQLSDAYIYPAYIKANLGSVLFNRGDYENAENAFIEAKESLVRYQNIKRSWLTQASSKLGSWLDFSWINPLSWFAQDPNAQAQGQIENDIERAEQKEQDALFDRINLGLAYTLLQQSDDDNALQVINTISRSGGESEQALLTLGWAMAQENRWQNALNVWQYLQQQSAGLYGLQASHGIAYAHQQRGEFSAAFFALEDTSNQIQSSLDALERFSRQVKSESFFDNVEIDENSSSDARRSALEREVSVQNADNQQASKPSASTNQFIQAYQQATGQSPAADLTIDSEAEVWPSSLLDIKRLFLSTNANFDAKYLLGVRAQAQQSLLVLKQKAVSLRTLEQMLSVRQQRFTERQQSLSLKEAEAALKKAQAQYQRLSNLLAENMSDANSQTLSKAMATPEQAVHIRRLDNASARVSRLNNAPQQRPLNPKYAQRLSRLQGIVEWQLNNEYPIRLQEHQNLLKSAKAAIENAQQQFASLSERRQDSNIFAEQQRKIDSLAINIINQQSQARAIFNQANDQLQQHLLAIIEQRTQELNQQSVNTRLAKLRLQDLRTEVQ